MNPNMESYREFNKHNLSTIDNEKNYAIANKQFWFSFYFDYFMDILANYFIWNEVPASIDKLFIERSLHFYGYIGFINTENFGLVCANGAMGNRLDLYDNPTSFTPINKTNTPFEGYNEQTNKIETKTTWEINWYEDMLSPNNATMVYNTVYHKPSVYYIDGFCSKLALIEQAIQLNRNAQNKPFMVAVDDKTMFSMKNLINNIMAGDPVVYVNARKNRNKEIENVQINDLIQVLRLDTPFILDKLQDEKQRVIGQILTFMGINNIPIDKAERLVVAEAESNNQLLNATTEMRLRPRRAGIERVNKAYGTNMSVEINNMIREYTYDRVMNDLDSERIEVINE